MKKLIAALLFASVFTSAFADTSVRGYHRKDGTYVQPHHRSSSNSTATDNWSTKGNTNPYTGQAGTKDPYKSSGSYGSNSGGYNSSNPYGQQQQSENRPFGY